MGWVKTTNIILFQPLVMYLSLVTDLCNDIRHTITNAGGRSWVPFLHAHRKFNVCLFSYIVFTLCPLSQGFCDNKKRDINLVLQELRYYLNIHYLNQFEFEFEPARKMIHPIQKNNNINNHHQLTSLL